MTSMERDIQKMLAEGASYDTIRTMLDEMEAAAKAEQNSKLTEAREAMVDAAIQYLIALDVISEEELAEIDMTPIMLSIEEGEKEIKDLLKTLDRLGGLFDPTPQKTVIKVRPVETHADAEKVIKDFVTKLEGLK